MISLSISKMYIVKKKSGTLTYKLRQEACINLAMWPPYHTSKDVERQTHVKYIYVEKINNNKLYIYLYMYI